VFEDGLESRDFVYIQDVVDATIAAIMHPGTESAVLNVGSGVSTSVLQVVEEIVGFFKSHASVSITGAFREGDIRHCVADLEEVKRILNFNPKWPFRDGLIEFLEWAETQDVGESRYEASLREMRERGLYHG
jgi:dTDP-L-rhamnose 4-epimerase